MEGDGAGPVVTHAGAVVECHQNLGVASQWRGQSGEWSYLKLPLVVLLPPKPDLVLLVVDGVVEDDLPHVESLAGP